MTGVYRGLTWQASSSDELIDIRQTIGSLAEDIVVAPNLVPKNNFAIRAIKAEEVRRKPGPLRIVFLSRISPMKNLDYLLRVLQRVKISAEFNIYGPNGDRVYWQECRQLIKMLPGNIRTVYHGALDHSKVSSVFRSHDVFVFPTRGENFGHVVYEALTAGAAVIISDRTPWRADDAGGCQVIPLNDFNGYVAAIERLAACSNEQLARLHEAAILHALRHDTSSDTLKANLDLFRSAISKFNFEAQNSPFR